MGWPPGGAPAPAPGAAGSAIPPAPPPLEEQEQEQEDQVLLPEGCERGAFIAAMKAQGIGIGVHCPAMHLFGLFRELGWRAGEFPQAERIGAEGGCAERHGGFLGG